MSISTDDRIAGPFSSGTVLPFDFKVFTTSDVRVVKTQADGTVLPDLTTPTDYSVTLNPDQDVDAGGEVTLVTAISGGASVVVTSDIPNTQPTTITNLGGFLPATLNTAFDRLCIQIQQLGTKVLASLQFPVSDGNVNTAELPTAAVRANKYLAFDANGDVVVNDGPVGGTPPSAFGEDLIQAADAAAAKVLLAISSVPYTAASASGPASLEFAEDTDNGAHKVTLKAPASLAANADVTLPASGTLATLDGTEALTNKSVNGVTLTASGSATKSLRENGTYVENNVVLAGYNTTDFSKTSDTTLALVTGCSVALQASKRYAISGWVPTTSASAGGIKLALVASGGLTATYITGEGLVNGGATAQTRISGLGSNIANLTGVTAAFVYFYGHINVNVAGTLELHFAQNTSNGTASVALQGSFIKAELLN